MVVMYIPTTFCEVGFILLAESMAKIVIKRSISQLLPGNSFSQTIRNPFHSLQIYLHLSFCVDVYIM